MLANLDSALILREMRTNSADILNTVRKTRLLIAESEDVIQKADDLLKNDKLSSRVASL